MLVILTPHTLVIWSKGPHEKAGCQGEITRSVHLRVQPATHLAGRACFPTQNRLSRYLRAWSEVQTPVHIFHVQAAGADPNA
jgi:hypothetical protein